MPTVQSLKKEIDSLKEESKKQSKWILYFQKNQAKLEKRISTMEGDPTPEVIDKPIQENTAFNSTNTENNSKSNKFVGGIILIVIGGLLCISIVGAILGIPLLIWGIILVSKRKKNSSTDKTTFKDEPMEVHTPKKKKQSQVIKKIESAPAKVVNPQKDTSFEENIGLKWFARIGILALVIGIGFFVKYSIDMGWINHLARVIMGVVIGIGLIVFGHIMANKEKYAIWAKTLIAGGFAITYFTIYAAYHFQEYKNAIGISLTLDIILLSLVVIGAILFSLKDNSQIIAGGSFFLGYITSLLSSNFEIMTIIYGLILTLGLVIVVSYKKWSILGTAGILASYILYLIWSANNPNSFGNASFILIAYFIAFTVQSYFLIKNKEFVSQNMLMVIINSAIFFVLYYYQFNKHHSDFTGLFTLILSIVCFAIYYLYKNMSEVKLAIVYLFLSLLYLTLAIPIQINPEWITIIWALEALMLIILFLKTNNDVYRLSSYFVGAFSALKLLLYDIGSLHSLDLTNIINSTRLLSFLVTIICFYSMYKLLKNNDALPKSESMVPVIYSWMGTGFLVLIILLELVKDYLFFSTVLLAVLALAYMISNKNIKEIRYQSIGISLILFIKVLTYDSQFLIALNGTDIFSSTRLFAFLISSICFYTIYKILKNNESPPDNERIIPIIYSWAGTGFLVLIILLELVKDYSMLSTIILAVLALTYMVFNRNTSELRYQSIGISLVLFFKVLTYDSWNLNYLIPTDFFASTRIFAFAASIIVFYVISWYLNNTKDELGNSENYLAIIYSYLGTILIFVLIVIELKDFWISIGWGLLALIIMIIGFVTQKKHLRIQGMIIFAITIGKVFLYDIRSLETIYRTISYIVLGILLLTVSFIYSKYKEKLKDIL